MARSRGKSHAEVFEMFAERHSAGVRGNRGVSSTTMTREPTESRRTAASTAARHSSPVARRPRRAILVVEGEGRNDDGRGHLPLEKADDALTPLGAARVDDPVGDDLDGEGRAVRLGVRLEPKSAAIGDRLNRGKPLRGVRVAEEHQGLVRVGLAEDALRRLRYIDTQMAAVRIDRRQIRRRVIEGRLEIGRDDRREVGPGIRRSRRPRHLRGGERSVGDRRGSRLHPDEADGDREGCRGQQEPRAARGDATRAHDRAFHGSVQSPCDGHRQPGEQQRCRERQLFAHRARDDGNNEQGPVHEVERVRDPADELHRPDRQHRGRAPPPARRSRDDDGGGAQHGERRGRPREHGRLGEEHRRTDDAGQPCPRGRGRERRGPAAVVQTQHGDERADAELPCARPRREVSPRLARRRHHDRSEERRRDEQDDAHGQRARRPPGRPPQHEQQRGPGDVELLLDTERPVVQQRRGRGLGEIVGGAVGEQQVRHEDEGRAGIVEHRLDEPGRSESRDSDHRRHDHGHRGRKQPPHASRVEGGEPDATRARELPQQVISDEQPRQHEEDIDADVAAGNERDARVVGDDEDDGDRAHPLEIGTEREPQKGGAHRRVAGRSHLGG